MLKTLIFSLLAVVCFSSAIAKPLRLSEPVQQDEISETFGAAISSMPTLNTLSEVLQEPDSYTGKPLALQVQVNKVCQKKGCFFIAQYEGQAIRVSFKDYGFFVPTDIGGKQVLLLGTLQKQNVSPAQAQHLSQDLGDKGRVKSGTQYQIIATTVRVFKELEASTPDSNTGSQF